MIDIISANTRHFTDMGWLQTYWLFSFSNYYDPKNIQHGTLRVFNDDIVQPHKGFATHPHEEMEIVSLVLDGEMEHKDTMGNTTIIRNNDVQRMTAGTGLHHSEWNHGNTPVHFFQIWILPDKSGLTPSYDQKHFSNDSWKNRLQLLASSEGGDDRVTLNSNGKIYRTQLDPRKSVTYMAEVGRKIFIYAIDGSMTINDRKMNKNDQARITDEKALTINGTQNTDLLLIDTPAQ